MNSKCPWDTTPDTLEECLEASEMQRQWEIDNGQPAPYHWNIVLTRAVFTSLIQRVIELEYLVHNE